MWPVDRFARSPPQACSLLRAAAEVVLLTVIVCFTAAGQSAQTPPPAEPDIVVRGQRSLQWQIERAEERLFATFNSLNSRDEFDIQCWLEAPTGSHIKYRVCAPRFTEDADAEAAQDFIVNGIPPSATSLRAYKQRELRDEMSRLADENPELRRALLEVVKLLEARRDLEARTVRERRERAAERRERVAERR
jgi:hypothetical protein